MDVVARMRRRIHFLSQLLSQTAGCRSAAESEELHGLTIGRADEGEAGHNPEEGHGDDDDGGGDHGH